MFLSLWAKWRNRRRYPGQKCQLSGQYSYSKHPHYQCTCTKGHTMPPPPEGQEGGWWVITDYTRHKG
jgi:hypothetical protein